MQHETKDLSEHGQQLANVGLNIGDNFSEILFVL